MDLSGFANPWEHARLLSDGPRNEALIEVIRRHAPGNRVLEVGCGTGLLSLIAARSGAEKVYAVEPTALVHVARELVAANGLQDTVEVLEGRVEDLAPQPVDFAFSELLNADPFYEGVVEAMYAARAWVRDGGLLAPRRLVVKAALARVPDSAREVRAARAEVSRLATVYGLDLALLQDVLQTDEPYKYMSQVVEIASEPVVAFDIALGEADTAPESAEIALCAAEPGPVSGVVVWFEAELDDGLILGNPPGGLDHWGQLVCAFAAEIGMRQGQSLALELAVEDGELEVCLA